FKSDAAGVKGTQAMFVQDALVTWKSFDPFFKIDAGFFLPPLAHNALQGAGTLYSFDYFANTFNHTNIFGAAAGPAGRDAGVELRGLVLDNHLEYRFGVFQGKRQAAIAMPESNASQNAPRFAGRIPFNAFAPET